MFITAILTKYTAVVRHETALRTDRRIKIMSEIINGIQVSTYNNLSIISNKDKFR